MTISVNANRTDQWKAHIAKSVDFFNEWFMRFAPQAYRETRVKTTCQVKAAFDKTASLTNLNADVLRDNAEILPILRMVTAPPLARDRLIGLANVVPHLVRSMELKGCIPKNMSRTVANRDLARIGNVIKDLADTDILPWLEEQYNAGSPAEATVLRAATIVADRLCGAVADPIIRNAQENRQLGAIQDWLERRGYVHAKPAAGATLRDVRPRTFCFRFNVSVRLADGSRHVKIPIDTVVMPSGAAEGDLPVLIEAKSAGDFTNTNKRRKEEAQKISQLRAAYGKRTRFVLFLCGYFDSGYLGYEAAEGIDWVWEHRIDDLARLGL